MHGKFDTSHASLSRFVIQNNVVLPLPTSTMIEACVVLYHGFLLNIGPDWLASNCAKPKSRQAHKFWYLFGWHPTKTHCEICLDFGRVCPHYGRPNIWYGSFGHQPSRLIISYFLLFSVCLNYCLAIPILGHNDDFSKDLGHQSHNIQLAEKLYSMESNTCDLSSLLA
jgi:hypothetical protein